VAEQSLPAISTRPPEQIVDSFHKHVERGMTAGSCTARPGVGATCDAGGGLPRSGSIDRVAGTRSRFMNCLLRTDSPWAARIASAALIALRECAAACASFYFSYRLHRSQVMADCGRSQFGGRASLGAGLAPRADLARARHGPFGTGCIARGQTDESHFFSAPAVRSRR